MPSLWMLAHLHHHPLLENSRQKLNKNSTSGISLFDPTLYFRCGEWRGKRGIYIWLNLVLCLYVFAYVASFKWSSNWWYSQEFIIWISSIEKHKQENREKKTKFDDTLTTHRIYCFCQCHHIMCAYLWPNTDWLFFNWAMKMISFSLLMRNVRIGAIYAIDITLHFCVLALYGYMNGVCGYKNNFNCIESKLNSTWKLLFEMFQMYFRCELNESS